MTASPIWESSVWMFGAIGALHRVTRRLEVGLPRPLVATYGPYQGAAHTTLTDLERDAIRPQVASIPLYQIATVAYGTTDPKQALAQEGRLRFLRLSEQLLDPR